MRTPLFSETDAEMLYFMPKVEATPKKIAWLFASCNRVAEPEREVMMDFLNKAVANGIVRACPNDRYVVCEVGIRSYTNSIPLLKMNSRQCQSLWMLSVNDPVPNAAPQGCAAF